MSLSATYVSGTQFTVSTDKTSDFIPGRAVRMDCGSDGIKYGYVSYSSYSAPNTTVYLDSTESQAITANLASVNFSRVASKETGGNVPLQVVWMNRGFKSGLTLSYKDADEIYIDSGALHIDNGSAENIYCAQSQLTKQLTLLNASAWYAIYVDPPDNGLTLAAGDIEYSTTMPTYDQAKRGWYHGTNTDWRCIGVLKSNASSQVMNFMMQGNLYRPEYDEDSLNWGDGNINTSLDVTLSVPFGSQLVLIRTHVGKYGGDSGVYAYTKGSGVMGAFCGYVNTYGNRMNMSFPIKCDANKKITLTADVRSSCGVTVMGIYLPDGI